MKRTISGILALALCLLALLPLSACKKEAGPLRILVDVPDKGNPIKMEAEFDKFLKLAEEKGGPTDIEVEWLSQEGEARKADLTRLRTEIMAGRGPDLFLIVEDFRKDPLFPYPEKSMRTGLFLTLDKYMEKSQFTQWEYQNSTILAAGKTDKGQQIIPMTYSMPVTCFRQGDTEHVPDASHTWDEMAESADLTQRVTCSGVSFAAHCMNTWGNEHLSDALGKLADFDSEELLFTEEDLLDCIHTKIELMDAGEQQGTFDSLPAFYQTNLAPDCFTRADRTEEPITADEPLTIIPQYSKQGGAAAYIKSYAAISNDTARPEDAFFLLDLFMSREVQTGSFVAGQTAGRTTYTGWICYNGSESGLPLDDRNGAIPPENQAALDAARGAITQVNYYDSMYNTLEQLMLECHNILSGWTEGDMDEQIRETYRVLGMSIKEA